jgi:hypothetical protein
MSREFDWRELTAAFTADTGARLLAIAAQTRRKRVGSAHRGPVGPVLTPPSAKAAGVTAIRARRSRRQPSRSRNGSSVVCGPDGRACELLKQIQTASGSQNRPRGGAGPRLRGYVSRPGGQPSARYSDTSGHRCRPVQSPAQDRPCASRGGLRGPNREPAAALITRLASQGTIPRTWQAPRHAPVQRDESAASPANEALAVFVRFCERNEPTRLARRLKRA